MVITLKKYNRCSSFFRFNREKEILLLADAHFNFYTLHKKEEGLLPEQEATLRIRDYYMFSTLTANIKIENT
jgi:hypothetical protein